MNEGPGLRRRHARRSFMGPKGDEMGKREVLAALALAVLVFGAAYLGAELIRSNTDPPPPSAVGGGDQIGVLGVSQSGGRNVGAGRVARLRRAAPLPKAPDLAIGQGVDRGVEGGRTQSGPSPTAAPSVQSPPTTTTTTTPTTGGGSPSPIPSNP